MIMADNRVDRRKHERFPIKQASVAYKPAGLLAALNKKNLIEGNVLVNMGQGGAQLTCPKHMMPGEKLSLKIAIPAFISSLNLTGKVIWCQKLPGARTFRAGVEFVKADKKTWRNVETLRRDVYFRSQGQSKILGGKRRSAV